MMHESDEALVALFREDGRSDAITILVERYTTPIYNLLVRLMGDRIEAEDLTQEVFMKMWKGLKRFDTTKSFKTWLFAIARNTAVDYLRKKKPTLFSKMKNEEDDSNFEESLPDESPLPDALFEQKELEGKLETALATLSLDDRTIIILHESDELSFEEISVVIGKPMNTVKSRYRRALQKLRATLSVHQNKA